jgi:FkbM family methyltransferase
MNILRNTIRALIGLIPATVVCYLAGTVFRGELLALSGWASGRSRCSLGQTVSTFAFVRKLVETRDSTKRSLRLLETEGDLQLWDTHGRKFWIPQTSTSRFPLVLAEQTEGIYQIGGSGVHAGDIVLDCGADVGTFTRTALDRGARLVVAIEPMPRKEICLRRTFAAEIAAGRVIVVPKGVWNKEDLLTLYEDSLVEQKAGRTWQVPLTTIDKIAEELRLPRVDYIKMDIEGAEKPALAGARLTLNRFRPRLSIATEHLADDAEAIPALIHQLRAKVLSPNA